MTGIERIAAVFAAEKTIKIMTHVVGGYPAVDTCEALIGTMAENGVDLIEIQLPFSDPTADGPVIVQANHAALQRGVTTDTVLTMIEKVRKKVDVPLLIMSYINPLYAYGINAIIEHAAEIGVDGFIVPDCPMDEPEPAIAALCTKHHLAFVPLIAPTTTGDRMVSITRHSVSPFVYAVLRMGVTGRKTELDRETVAYLHRIKEQTGRFVAAGFGIREQKQIDALTGHADCAIIGSELLRQVTGAVEKGEKPADAVAGFLEHLKP